jgi:hypothetical protein
VARAPRAPAPSPPKRQPRNAMYASHWCILSVGRPLHIGAFLNAPAGICGLFGTVLAYLPGYLCKSICAAASAQDTAASVQVVAQRVLTSVAHRHSSLLQHCQGAGGSPTSAHPAEPSPSSNHSSGPTTFTSPGSLLCDFTGLA